MKGPIISLKKNVIKSAHIQFSFNRLKNFMCAKRLITIVFLLLLAICQSVNSQTLQDYEHLKNLYNKKKFSELYDKAVSLRKKQYGKNWKTDYFISKALCAASDNNLAMRAFDYTLTVYKRDLNNNQFEFLLSERDKCSETQSVGNIPAHYAGLHISIIDNETSGVSGKMGYIVNCNTDPNTFSVDSSFDYQSLNQRIFSVDEIQTAANYYRNLLGTGYSCIPRGRYLFIVPAATGANDETFNRIAGYLENAYNFYAEFFELRKPENIIAVYLMNTRENLRKMAKKTHGLTIPDSNIGYSCLADLSLLGTSTTESIGTIVHELFHLMIRADVGDIPTWLDEAVACLYETSRWTGGLLKGEISQWRTEILLNLVVPRLDGLFATNFNEFTSHEHVRNYDQFAFHEGNNNCEIALNYALVKHFAIFLQETGKLKETINGFKERKNVLVDTLYHDETDVEVLERVFNKPFDEIQAEFDSWLSYMYPLNPDRSVHYILSHVRYIDYCGDEALRQTKANLLQKLGAASGQLTDEQIKEINRFIMEARYYCTK